MLELPKDIRFSEVAKDSEMREDALVDRVLEFRRLSPFANLTRCPTQEAVDAITNLLAYPLAIMTFVQGLTGS